MSKAELGTKRICVSCGARFYDLTRDPAVCPKCGQAQPPLAPRSSGAPIGRAHIPAHRPAPLPAAVEEPAPEEAALEEVEVEVELDEDEDEAVAAIEEEDDEAVGLHELDSPGGVTGRHGHQE